MTEAHPCDRCTLVFPNAVALANHASAHPPLPREEGFTMTTNGDPRNGLPEVDPMSPTLGSDALRRAVTYGNLVDVLGAGTTTPAPVLAAYADAGRLWAAVAAAALRA